MQGVVEIVGGERESISACETKKGAEGEGGGASVCVCARTCARACV